MPRILMNWFINAAAIGAAFWLVPGIEREGRSLMAVLGLAFIFGLLNAVVRPVLKLFTCPFLVLTLGFGILLINALMFWMAGYIGRAFDVGFRVDGFWPAFVGALVVSVVSFLLHLIFPERSGDEDRGSDR